MSISRLSNHVLRVVPRRETALGYVSGNQELVLAPPAMEVREFSSRDKIVVMAADWQMAEGQQPSIEVVK